MIKFIDTEGKTDQEVQDYMDQCVIDGAKPYERISGTKTSIEYSYEEISLGKYAGVHIDGDTYTSDHIDDFVDVESLDIPRLLNIEECAKKICNAVFETGDHDEIEKQAIEMRSLLS